ncbi:MAG: SdiA-regulated domain-containing protein [Campylobacterota bacterium]|nr:SdiA-regulated domain-containing protein [Campylobacterota bacterium]
MTTLLTAKTIAEIPEASGICYIASTKTLLVANDEGWLYEITPKGKLVRKRYIGKYDLEGISYSKDNDELYLANEAKNSILVMNRFTFEVKKEIKIKKKFKGKEVFGDSKKSGIEAIAFFNGELYLSHQASHVFRVGSLKKNKTKITEVYKHGYKDIAGLAFRDGFLYMLSDKKNLLIKYDIKKKKTLQKIKLPKFAQEGICFDEKNNVYFADDNGHVLKFKIKELGIKK